MGGLTKEERTPGGNCGGGILGEFGPFGPEPRTVKLPVLRNWRLRN